MNNARCQINKHMRGIRNTYKPERKNCTTRHTNARHDKTHNFQFRSENALPWPMKSRKGCSYGTIIASFWTHFHTLCLRMFATDFFSRVWLFSVNIWTHSPQLHCVELPIPSNGLLPRIMPYHSVPCHSWTSDCLPVCWAITPPLSVHSAASLRPIRNLGDNVFLQTASKPPSAYPVSLTHDPSTLTAHTRRYQYVYICVIEPYEWMYIYIYI